MGLSGYNCVRISEQHPTLLVLKCSIELNTLLDLRDFQILTFFKRLCFLCISSIIKDLQRKCFHPCFVFYFSAGALLCFFTCYCYQLLISGIAWCWWEKCVSCCPLAFAWHYQSRNPIINTLLHLVALFINNIRWLDIRNIFFHWT